MEEKIDKNIVHLDKSVSAGKKKLAICKNVAKKKIDSVKKVAKDNEVKAKKYYHHHIDSLDEDLSVDMKKIGSYEVLADDDLQKAKLLASDVHEVAQDWKKVLHSSAYITGKIPNLVDALHETEKVISDCRGMASENIVGKTETFFKDGDLQKMEKIYTDLDDAYDNRQKCVHSLIAIERWTKNVEHIVTQAIVFCHKHDENAEEKVEKAERSLEKRLKSLDSKISNKLHLHHGSKEKEGKPTVPDGGEKGEKNMPPKSAIQDDTVKAKANKHISMKEESENIVSSFVIDTKLVVTDGEDTSKFIKNNKATIEAFEKEIKSMKTEWKLSLKAIANVQSIIPLVNEAMGEVEAIAKLVRDALGAAALNPSSFIALLEDGKHAFDDAKAVYEIGEKIKGVIASADVLGAFVNSATELITTGRVLVNAISSLNEGAETKEKSTAATSS